MATWLEQLTQERAQSLAALGEFTLRVHGFTPSDIQQIMTIARGPIAGGPIAGAPTAGVPTAGVDLEQLTQERAQSLAALGEPTLRMHGFTESDIQQVMATAGRAAPPAAPSLADLSAGFDPTAQTGFMPTRTRPGAVALPAAGRAAPPAAPSMFDLSAGYDPTAQTGFMPTMTRPGAVVSPVAGRAAPPAAPSMFDLSAGYDPTAQTGFMPTRTRPGSVREPIAGAVSKVLAQPITQPPTVGTEEPDPPPIFDVGEPDPPPIFDRFQLEMDQGLDGAGRSEEEQRALDAQDARAEADLKIRAEATKQLYALLDAYTGSQGTAGAWSPADFAREAASALSILYETQSPSQLVETALNMARREEKDNPAAFAGRAAGTGTSTAVDRAAGTGTSTAVDRAAAASTRGGGLTWEELQRTGFESEAPEQAAERWLAAAEGGKAFAPRVEKALRSRAGIMATLAPLFTNLRTDIDIDPLESVATPYMDFFERQRGQLPSRADISGRLNALTAYLSMADPLLFGTGLPGDVEKDYVLPYRGAEALSPEAPAHVRFPSGFQPTARGGAHLLAEYQSPEQRLALVSAAVQAGAPLHLRRALRDQVYSAFDRQQALEPEKGFLAYAKERNLF
jgi:hypothetical protein